MNAQRLAGRPGVRAATCRGRQFRRRCVVKCVSAPLSPTAGRADEDNCRVFVDRDGEMIRVMCCDYGFRAGAGRLYQENYGEVPDDVFTMAKNNFNHELVALRRSFRFNEYAAVAEAAAPTSTPLKKAGNAVGGVVVRALAALDLSMEGVGILPKLSPKELPPEVAGEDGGLSDDCKEIRERLSQLKLSDPAVWAREAKRVAEEGEVNAPWYIRAPFWALCVVLDMAFGGRPIQRFWVLETVARIPYFAYISILHLYESLGFWRAGAELRKVHFAEEWNELHHLQIMESLGGDQLWIDRFIAEHSAILYYWLLIVFYLFSPRLAYVFSELVELHATDTYAEFVVENEELLKSLPPPVVAAAYYRNEDLYMFDEMQQAASTSGTPLRRPVCNTLYDVFSNIRDDEIEHVKTMHACQDKSIARNLATWRGKRAL